GRRALAELAQGTRRAAQARLHADRAEAPDRRAWHAQARGRALPGRRCGPPGGGEAAAAAAGGALSTGERLKVTEIFHSLQGEAQYVGIPTVFVRLTGCPLRCQYCDTAYAFHGGEWRTIPDILAKVAGYGAKDVCVTGGEPLAQRRCLDLLRE